MENLSHSYFFFSLPLYSPIKITDENQHAFASIIALGAGEHKNISFDGYNPLRGQISTFTGWAPVEDVGNFYASGGVGTIRIKCKRYEDVFTFLVRFNKKEMIFSKVGQYPSVASFHIDELKQYDKILSKDKLKEFTRAIGLAANGVGIGSFVYLRRLFEYLIWTTFDEQKAELSLKDEDFSRLRIEDKIQALKSVLPKFLVENSNLYSILSLGIHQLNEVDCLNHFDTVRMGIEIILDEKLDEVKRNEKIKIAKQKISDLHSKLKN
ncbi:MAG: hypothetical protein SFY56_01720 [Bacteroidota bacterium]|nr:hypothetical protein [Bacteroidota bacterium]